MAPRLGLSINADALNSVTRGLVGDTAFAVLPEITPRMTFILTLLFQLVSSLLHYVQDEPLTRLACTGQTLHPAYLGYFYRCCNPLRVCIILVRMARA